MAMFSTFNGACSQGYQPLATAFTTPGVDAVYWDTLSGMSSFSSGIFMLWVNTAAISSNSITIFNCDVQFSVSLADISPSPPYTTFRPTISMGGGGGGSLVFRATNPIVLGTWVQILASWNTNFAAGNKIANMVVNGTLATTVINDSGPAFSVPYENRQSKIGYVGSTAYGCFSELYFAPNQFIDLTVEANRLKFIAAGNPVYLGVTGSNPTGVAPIIYLRNPATTYNVNSGTGGNGTKQGTLVTCGSAP